MFTDYLTLKAGLVQDVGYTQPWRIPSSGTIEPTRNTTYYLDI